MLLRTGVAMKAALSQKYGIPEDYDFLSAGALWKGSEDFAASLDQNERTLTSFWMDVSDPANEVKSIKLEAKAARLSDTYVTLSYELKNFGQCASIQDKADNSGL
jgi:hypothetical protein